MTFARYSYRVWWGVVLVEEARMVIGEGCGCVPAKLVRVPPASRTAAPPHARSGAKSVVCALSCVLPCLRRIISS
jgi:hypothetical protein